MARPPKKDMAASVRQRLLNISRAEGKPFDVVLVAYGLERLIYRLSKSQHKKNLILKGGMLVTLWTLDENRTTRDADFLGHGDLSEDRLREVFIEIMQIEVDDGLVFDVDALKVIEIRGDQEYGGFRLKTNAYLKEARIPITIDIGFGDAIANPRESVDYPSLLGMPQGNIRIYPPETVIAEKFQAIVDLGLANGRMKDYYDLWAIPNVKKVAQKDLDAAILATFERRKTEVPQELPVGLSPTFVTDDVKLSQWEAYAESIDLEDLTLETVVNAIWGYLGPACDRITRSQAKS